MFEILSRYAPGKYLPQLREHLKTPLYGNAYLLIINQGGSAVLGFLYWTIAARFYSAQAVGKSSAIISTLILLSMLSELSLRAAVQRFIPRAGRGVTRLILFAYGISLLASGVLTVGFFIAGGALHLSDSLFTGLSPVSLGLLVLAAMFWTVFFIQDGVLIGLRQAQWVLWENTFYNVSKIILLVIGVYGLLGDGIVVSWFLPTTLAVFVVNGLVFTRFIPLFRQANPFSAKPVTRREAITSVAGDHVGTTLAEISTRLLPLMIVNLIGTDANAYFYQAWLIASMVYSVSVNVNSSYTVEVSADFNRIGYYSRKTMRYMAVLILPITLVLIGIAPIILDIYGGAYSQQGTPVLRWLALAALPYGFNSWFITYARVRADVKAIIWNQGLQCVLVLGLSYGWMRSYGITSIGVAWLIAQTIPALMALFVTRRLFFGEEKKQRNTLPLEGAAPKGQPDEVEKIPGGIAVTGNGPQPAEPKGTVNIFLSPHLDDAVLSCGGFMRRLVSAGEQVIIATVFTGDPPEGWPISWLAARNLRAWGLGKSAFNMRRMEDEAAAQRLGVETVHLGLLDAMYRCGKDGSPYYEKNIVGVPIAEEDEMLTGQALRDGLAQLASRFSTAGRLRIFTPICAGKHVDHLLVRCSAEAVFGERALIYYEDHPYAAHPGIEIHPNGYEPDSSRGSWVSAHVTLSEKEVEARVEAAAYYGSQIPGLYPSPTERMLEIFSARVPLIGRHLWDYHWHTLDRRKSHQRMAKSLTDYIIRVGGENYWYFAPRENEGAGIL